MIISMSALHNKKGEWSIDIGRKNTNHHYQWMTCVWIYSTINVKGLGCVVIRWEIKSMKEVRAMLCTVISALGTDKKSDQLTSGTLLYRGSIYSAIIY
jgi:hypothetical protein